MTIPIERCFNIRAAYAPTLSPDGRQVAFIATITGVPQVWVMDSGGGWPDPLTFGADRVLTLAWSPTSQELLFSRDVGGNENAQLFLVNADGSGERRLTSDDGAMHLFGAWSPDGRAIAYAANRRDRSRYDLYWQDVRTGDEHLIWTNDEPGFLWPAAFAPDGRRLLINHLRGNMDTDLYELTLPVAPAVPGPLRRLTPHTGETRYVNPVYNADGRALFLACDHDRDFLALTHLDLDTLELTIVEAPAAEVEEVALTPDGAWLAWAENHDGAHLLRARRLDTGETRTAPLPSGVVYPAPSDIGSAALTSSAASGGPRAVFAFTTPTRTADIWVWDLDANGAAPVTRSSHAGIPPDSLVEPDLIRYPTFDGLHIPAWFYRARPAAGAGPRPVIVYVHGGPEGQTQAMLFPLFQYFVNRGYHVLAPNVRGSSGYGKHYLNLDNVERRLDSVADLAHAVHWLRQQPEVAGDCIAVYGGSYGGFMVLAALTRYPDLWAAGVDLVGIANFITFLENTGAYRRAVREAEYGSLAHHRALLESLSPIHMVDRIRAPLFVIHGRNDPRVPLGEAEQIVAALRARAVPVEFIVYADEGHGLVKLANKLDAYPKVADFLDQHLLGARKQP